MDALGVCGYILTVMSEILEPGFDMEPAAEPNGSAPSSAEGEAPAPAASGEQTTEPAASAPAPRRKRSRKRRSESSNNGQAHPAEATSDATSSNGASAESGDGDTAPAEGEVPAQVTPGDPEPEGTPAPAADESTEPAPGPEALANEDTAEGEAEDEDTDTDENTSPPVTDSGTPQEVTTEQVVEAVLFGADVPLTPARIIQIIGTGTARDVRKHIEDLNVRYEQTGASFRIEKLAGGYQMLTVPAFNPWLKRLKQNRQESKLSQAAMETLAVVAYKQPVVRAEIEAIRGVATGEMLNRLRELGLVKIVGRAEDVGRPLLYGTTKRFLDVFGLGSLEDLPTVEELKAPGE